MTRTIAPALWSVFLMLSVSVAMSEQLTVERIYEDPALDGPNIRGLQLAPDGSRVTFLRGKDSDQEQQDLWEYHIADGETRLLVDSTAVLKEEEELSDEEKARRERQRISGLKGIVDYSWGEDGQRILFPLGGDIHVWDLDKQASTRLTRSEAYENDPRLSPRGSFVAFTRDQDLYAIEVETGREMRLTTDGGGTIKNGMAEFIAQEEMDRDTGYWWSEDESRIAFIRVDESPVDIARRYEIYAEDVTVIEQRYPYTGTPNVKVQLGVVTLADGEIQWIDLGDDEDIYLPRVDWHPDSRHLAYQVQSRDQKRLELWLANSESGEKRRLLSERSDTWINLHRNLAFLKHSEDFIWGSERTGFMHLYRYGLDGDLKGALTAGEWQVDKLLGVDEERGGVYFLGAADSVLEKHLYFQPFDASQLERPRRITSGDWHDEIKLADDHSSFVSLNSGPKQPPRVTLHRIDGSEITALLPNALDDGHPYHPYLDHHVDAEYGTLTAVDGQTMHYRLYKPRGMEPGQRYPVVFRMYGGPGAQLVNKRWNDYHFDQVMAQRGYAVFTLDNRGMARRGTAFADPLHRRMGQNEVRDQATGVEFLRSQDWVDGERIGIFGWSYGGYMTLMAMLQEPDLFKVGVAVAPVTDWRLYDTHYTERYMSTPEDNPEGYREGNVISYAGHLKGKLMVIHGMADDNVLFTHATKLYSALQDRRLMFDQMNYPGAKHRISGQDTRIHVFNTIVGYFEEHL